MEGGGSHDNEVEVKKRPAAKKRKSPPVPNSSDTANDNVTTITTAATVAWSTAFATPLIKETLKEEEDMGMLLKPAVDLVGACSAIFIRNLLAQAAVATAANTTTPAAVPDSSTEPNVATLTLEGLRRTIAEHEQFQFLQGVLDDLEEEQHAALKSTSLLMSDITMASKKSAVSVKKHRKGLSNAGAAASLDKEVLQAAADDTPSSAATARITEIVADEEDYD